ncbi:MAG: YiiD C-terminal domain-containing protein [Pseudomonadota bacterium]
MSVWGDIARSWLSMKRWVKAWLFFLNAVFLAALAFLDRPEGRWILIAYVASGPLLLAIAWRQRGLTRILGVAHLLPWLPLLVYVAYALILGEVRLQGEPWLYGYLVVLAATLVLCLSLDAWDVLRWLRGERFVLGSDEAFRRGASALAPPEPPSPRRWAGETAKRLFTEHGVPFNRALGLKVVEVAPDSSRVALRLPHRRRNTNDGGSVHGGAILALAESVHGVAVLWQFSPREHRMVTKHAAIRYLAPAHGEIRVAFSLEPDMKLRIATELGRSGKCEFSLSSVVRDEHDAEVARLDATYVIRRKAGAAR